MCQGKNGRTHGVSGLTAGREATQAALRPVVIGLSDTGEPERPRRSEAEAAKKAILKRHGTEN